MKTFDELKSKLNLSLTEYDIKDISHEVWREYEHGGHTFRINNPVVLIIRKNGTTHRVVDSTGITHCHPMPGNGCGLRWYNGEKTACKF
ncbi:hypothetical protein M0R04_05650 [Candidatus Dojkabacteria bacterium]|jgi:hypothetical protein|nr:hypothetical protein [Candidatus Dojkabacteria bacterium]